jgi:hypothetical protein
MSPKLGFPDPEQLRGEKILHQMEKLEQRKESPKVLGCLPWVLFAVLVQAIMVLALVHWERLSDYWQRLVKPDSIPASGPVRPSAVDLVGLPAILLRSRRGSSAGLRLRPTIQNTRL